MIRFKQTSILFLLLIGFSNGSSFAQAVVSKVSFTKLLGYQMKMAMAPSESTGQLYYRKEQFFTYFENKQGEAQGKIDFGKEVIISMVFPKSKTETLLNLERINKVDANWEIYFTSKKGKKGKKETISQALFLAKIDKTISGIVIYLDGKIHTDLRN